MQRSVIVIGIIVVVAIGAYAVLGSQNQNNSEKQNNNINWHTDLNAALQEAKNTNKPVFVDFYATWCGACRQLDENTFSDPAIQEKLSQKYVPVKIDVDKNSQLASDYKVYAFPTMVLLNSDGSEIKRMVGYVDANELLNQL